MSRSLGNEDVKLFFAHVLVKSGSIVQYTSPAKIYRFCDMCDVCNYPAGLHYVPICY